MDFQELLLKICKVLDELKIPYAITGGYAVSVWGRPRSTFDIDVIIELYQHKVKELIHRLKNLSEISYIEESAVLRAIGRHGEFNFIHSDSGIKVDFWVLGKDLLSNLKLTRRICKKIGNQKVFFLSPEDLIISKLVWYEASQSDRQLEDIESVIEISKKILDMKYIKNWVKKLNLQEIWEKIKK